MKPIRLSRYALRYISKRGFTVAEVEDTICTVAGGSTLSHQPSAELLQETFDRMK